MYKNRHVKEVLSEILKETTYKTVAIKSKEGYKKILGENFFTRDVRPDRIFLLVEDEVVKEFYIG